MQQRERAEHEVQIKDLKSKLRNEQHEREQEQTHHVAMLRELQHMLGIDMQNLWVFHWKYYNYFKLLQQLKGTPINGLNSNLTTYETLKTLKNNGIYLEKR